MQINTHLSHVVSCHQFGNLGKAVKSGWHLCFSDGNFNNQQPMVVEYHFHAKPTKKQIRKLRRAFRKEAA